MRAGIAEIWSRTASDKSNYDPKEINQSETAEATAYSVARKQFQLRWEFYFMISYRIIGMEIYNMNSKKTCLNCAFTYLTFSFDLLVTVTTTFAIFSISKKNISYIWWWLNYCWTIEIVLQRYSICPIVSLPLNSWNVPAYKHLYKVCPLSSVLSIIIYDYYRLTILVIANVNCWIIELANSHRFWVINCELFIKKKQFVLSTFAINMVHI